VLLAGCRASGPPAAPAPAVNAAPVDVARIVFGTNPAYNVGPAWIYDAPLGLLTGELVRVAYSLAALIETHSVYGLGTDCIHLRREESRDRPPTRLLAVQTYLDAPCWAPLTILPGQSLPTRIPASRWYWNNAEGAQGSGVFDDSTLVSLSDDGRVLTLLEWYRDPDWAGTVPDYCMLSTFDAIAGGMRKLEPGNCKDLKR